MKTIVQDSTVPSLSEIEDLIINNHLLDRIQSHLTRFNPIRVMKMEDMEIRHSGILAWLLDPSETHGLSDRFLRAFLAEALRGHGPALIPTALEVSQSDLRDAEVRPEWLNIDIFVRSQSNNWAFTIENKYHSKQRKGQLSGYTKKVKSVYRDDKALKIRGVFLTRWEEEPEDKNYAPVNYEAVCMLLERILERNFPPLSPEVRIFLDHYVDILQEETEMNNETKELQKLGRELYLRHKRAIDFLVEQGSLTDFSTAVRSVFGDNTKQGNEVTIGKRDFIFGTMSSNTASFLPSDWIFSLQSNQSLWAGCESWWIGYPLALWFSLIKSEDGKRGQLRLNGEVGPIANYQVRKALIDCIEAIGHSQSSKNIRFQKGAKDEGRRYSRFFKGNSIKLEDVQDPIQIERAMKALLIKFNVEIDAITNALNALKLKL